MNANSIQKHSDTTISTYDELRTPNDVATGYGGFQFQLPDQPKPQKSVEGPVGPHLFRLSQLSTASSQMTSRDVPFTLSMSPPMSPQEIPRHHSPPPLPIYKPAALPIPPRDAPLRTWDPSDVAEWMHVVGFEDILVEQFFTNDISGVTLLELQYEDLKELGITSFGQRRRLWNEISRLKELHSSCPPSATLDSNWQPLDSPRPGPTMNSSRKCSNPGTPEDERTFSPANVPRHARRARRASDDIISPAESASIVAIEQLLPKPHKCSKGENCAKWQKQQRKLARIATEFPMELRQISDARLSPTGSGMEPPSVVGPSVVASSDLLGPAQLPPQRLQEEALRDLQSRDPQENVRQFLNFQHVASRQAPEDPVTPPYEMFPPLSPPVAQTPHSHLRNLPKLTIPTTTAPDPFSPNATARPPVRGTPVTAMEWHGAQDIFRLASPASEMDVPLTAIPLGPIERDVSSSVPPDMRFGGADPIQRSNSRSEFRRPPPSFSYGPIGNFHSFNPISRSQSVSGPRQPPMPRLPETKALNLNDITGEEEMTPTASEIHRAGWMKKRKTKMLRHEWQENHFRLNGTRLAMHKDEKSNQELETIDVVDYSVACSVNSSKKINTAFKALKISGKKKEGDNASAYTFQLLPTAEKKGILNAANGKTHHFAVNTGNDRIEWMRDLLLAKASSQKGEGYQVVINGNSV